MGEADEVARLRRENAALRRAVELMHQIADLARESLELEGVAYAVLTGVTAGVGLGLNRAMLFVSDPDDRTALVGMAAVGPKDREDADRVWKSIERAGPDLRTLYQSGQELRSQPKQLDARVRELRVSLAGDTPIALAFRNDAVVCGAGEDDLAGLLHGPTAVAAPLRGRHSRLGVLYADNVFTGQPLDEVTQSVFGMVAGHAGRALDNARSYEKILRVSQTDALTGLGHHGALEEFTALLTGVDRSGAQLVAERLRRAVHDEAFSPSKGTTRLVTCSLGVATLSGSESAGDLLARADAALLQAKREGKNRVVEAP